MSRENNDHGPLEIVFHDEEHTKFASREKYVPTDILYEIMDDSKEDKSDDDSENNTEFKESVEKQFRDFFSRRKIPYALNKTGPNDTIIIFYLDTEMVEKFYRLVIQINTNLRRIILSTEATLENIEGATAKYCDYLSHRTGGFKFSNSDSIPSGSGMTNTYYSDTIPGVRSDYTYYSAKTFDFPLFKETLLNFLIDAQLNYRNIERIYKRQLSFNEMTKAKKEEVIDLPGKNLLFDIKKHLDKSVFEQEEAKKTLSIEVTKLLKDQETRPVLMIGPTGSGKSYMLQILEKYEHMKNINFVYADASQFTPVGFQGESFLKLRKAVNGRKAIVILDEIDKILIPNYDGHDDNVNDILQGQLLAALGHTDEAFDKTLFILSGSFIVFNSLEEKKKNPIGFRSEITEEKITDEFSYDNTREKLLKIGAKEELVGRIGSIVFLKELSDEAKEKIFIRDFEEQKKLFDTFDISLEITEEAKQKIISIMTCDFGARSIYNYLNQLLKTSPYDCLAKECKKTVISLKNEKISLAFQ